tara:strand:+ start:3221 stop:4387 length:1167 start_codon:yes stop_codon:yes gene_type:complete
MKKKIAILGSTGTIGFTTLKIVNKDKGNFQIVLLSTNNNVKKIFKQAKKFNVKNVIVKDHKSYLLWKSRFNKNNIKLYNNFESLNKIFIKKIDYCINAITGIDGLDPTLRIIKHTRKIAIANKESIICGWNLINKELIKNNTRFIPVDSEHFSIFSLIGNEVNFKVKKIIITASGGPFLNKKINKNIKISDALNHPNWKMGKKITIDSATLMNKVFEVIEAKKIFNLNFNQIEILVNPNSYVHAIIIFDNGTIKILAHETNMDIPIFNSIYENSEKKRYETKDFNLKKFNNLKLNKPDTNKFKLLKIIKFVPQNNSLFETVLVTVNDELVNMFLNKKISFYNLCNYLIKIINFKNLKKYCKVKPSSINQIYKVRNDAKLIVNKYVNKI